MRVGSAVALGILGAVTVGVGRVFGLMEMYVLGTALVTASLLAILVTRSRIVLVDIERTATTPEPRVGDEIGLEIRIRALRSTPGFQLRDHISDSDTGSLGRVEVSVPPLGRNQETRSRYRVRAETRGVITLGPATVEHGDPVGLARWTRPIGLADAIVVSPNWSRLALPDLRECDGELVQAIRDITRNLARDREFRSLREFVQGDDSRTINWRATARRDTLIVNEYESHADVLLDVFLDLDASTYTEDGFERAVSVAASFVGSAPFTGDVGELASPSGDVRRGDSRVTVRLSLADPQDASFFDSLIEGSARREAMKALALVTPIDRAPRPRRSTSKSAVPIPVLICGRRDFGWFERTRRDMGGSTIGIVVLCEEDSTIAVPERWFVVDGADFDFFAQRWTRLCRPARRS